MRKLLAGVMIALALAVVVPLGGCATFQNIKDGISAAANFKVTQNQLDGARNTYDGTVLATLKNYALLPRCAPGTGFSITNRCHDKALLKRIRNADAAVAAAFDATQDQITSGNDSGAVAAYQTLQTAIDAIKQIIAANNLTLL